MNLLLKVNRGKQTAQAVTELAILGALVIVAFSFLINYSEKLNRQQANIQQTFRAALEEAKKANNSAAYTKKVFLRMPNVASPMELGQLESFADTASVLWKDGKDRDDVYGYDDETKEWSLLARYARPGVVKYQLNEEVRDLPRPANEYDDEGNLIAPLADNYDDEDNLIAPLPSVTTTDKFTNKVEATTILTQKTGSDGIVTKKKLKAKDTLTAVVNIDGKEQIFIHTLGEGGKYSPEGKGINR